MHYTSSLVVVASIHNLRTYIPPNRGPNIVLVEAYRTPNDGGGGLFFWDPSSGAADDGGITIRSAVVAGAWLRLFNGPVDVRWFGARADWTGTTGTDDSPAIQAAVDSGYPVYLSAGEYLITSKIRLHRDTVIGGDGRDESVLVTACLGWSLGSGVGAWSFDIHDLGIRGSTSSQAAATASGLDCLSAAHNWRLSNVGFSFLNQAMAAACSYIGQARDVYVFNCGTPTLFAIDLQDVNNNVHFDNLQIRALQGQWQGRGIRVVNTGVCGIPSPRTDDIGFRNLSLEEIDADYAGLFSGNDVTIVGGYWEQRGNPSANRARIECRATLVGVTINCPVEVDADKAGSVTYIGCRFLQDPEAKAMNVLGGSMVDGRFTLALDSVNGRLPRYEQRVPVPSTLLGPGNFRHLSPGSYSASAVTSWGLGIRPGGGSNNYSIQNFVNVGFNTQPRGLRVISMGAGDWLGLPFVNNGVRKDVYAWAIVFFAGGGDIELWMRDPSNPNDGRWVGTPQTGWVLLALGPIQPWTNVAYLRVFGSGGRYDLDSWGVSFGGLDYSVIGRAF